MAVFWVVALCSLVDVYQRFRGTYASNIRAITTTQKTAVFILGAMRTLNPSKAQFIVST
jgi:hypothetical protein